MKTIYLFFISFLCMLPNLVKAQLEKVIVETYYVSNANDTGVFNQDTNQLTIGSKTYRVYVDLKAGSKLIKLYGARGHALKFSSTSNFFNKKDRAKDFGHLYTRTDLRRNTVALDTWLTLARTTATSNVNGVSLSAFGILKSKDNTGSNLLIPHNPAVALTNNDTSAGLPISQIDGNIDIVGAQPAISAFGIIDIVTGIDTTIFGYTKPSNQFINTDVFLRADSGIVGADTSNQILVAQLTTMGDLSFELNIEVRLSNGTIKSYVASETKPVSGDTILNAALKYPAACGCKDVNFLEYSNTFSCSLPSACITPLVLGCLDTNACNYNSNANFNVSDMCCYVGYCNDRNLAVVCPSVNSNRVIQRSFSLYPNQVDDFCNVVFEMEAQTNVTIEIFNAYGIKVRNHSIEAQLGKNLKQINTANLENGVYLLRLNNDNVSNSKIFIKQ